MNPSEHPPLGLAFLGCGAATVMHSRTLRSLGAPVRRFYASRTAETAHGLAQRLGGVAFPSYDEAITAPAVDAVFVATPPHLHRELTLSALRAGKHVIVEKPAFLTTADFGAVEAAGTAAGRLVLVAENYFYKPIARMLRETLARQALGRVLFLNVVALKRQDARGWRSDPALAGGGALFEGGVHWINFMGNLGLEVEAVRRFAPRHSSDSSSLLVFEYAGGEIGTLLHSWEAHSPLRGLRTSRIHGTEGTVTFESNGLFALVNGRQRRLHLGGRDIAGYRAMFRDFLATLTTGREPQFDLRRARRDHELLESVGAHHAQRDTP
jgi:predicted dehydrogenase